MKCDKCGSELVELTLFGTPMFMCDKCTEFICGGIAFGSYAEANKEPAK